MTFRRDVDLDPGQVQDRRGGRRVRGGGVALGGGIGSLVILALVLFLGGDIGDLAGLGGGGVPAEPGPLSSEIATECQTGADANEREDCRIVGTVNSLRAYWSEAFAGSDRQFAQPGTVVFDDQVNTECGAATSAVGPFYCPLDQTIYLDLGFFDQLESQFGAQGGEFAEEYIVAHEYGHHIQNLLGLLESGRDAGSEGGAVRTELQADCFAGVWGGNAVETEFLEPLTQEQIGQALNAAQVIGDDRIQEQTQGQVNPETWTHGSSQQRQEWLR
ncbi:MAG: neutral zinc metallopeptidase [Chloroflexi bacterium]|nr:neutral zinc metallopeptidase [Chloroflexota bacterium]